MKNKLINLNDHLFESLERLNDEDLKGEELQEEIERSKAMTHVAEKIIDNASLMYKAAMSQAEYYGTVKMPQNLLESNDKSNES